MLIVGHTAHVIMENVLALLVIPVNGVKFLEIHTATSSVVHMALVTMENVVVVMVILVNGVKLHLLLLLILLLILVPASTVVHMEFATVDHAFVKLIGPVRLVKFL